MNGSRYAGTYNDTLGLKHGIEYSAKMNKYVLICDGSVPYNWTGDDFSEEGHPKHITCPNCKKAMKAATYVFILMGGSV